MTTSMIRSWFVLTVVAAAISALITFTQTRDDVHQLAPSAAPAIEAALA